MAAVIWLTYMETKGLTLEQIDKRFEGVPRNQLGVIEAVDGRSGMEKETSVKTAEEDVKEMKN